MPEWLLYVLIAGCVELVSCGLFLLVTYASGLSDLLLDLWVSSVWSRIILSILAIPAFIVALPFLLIWVICAGINSLYQDWENPM